MKRLLLIGNISERKKLIKQLHKSDCVEVTLASDYTATNHIADIKREDELQEKIAKLEALFKSLKTSKNELLQIAKDNKNIKYKPIKLDGLLIAKPSLTFEELSESSKLETEVFDTIAKIDEINNQMLDDKNNKQRYKTLIDQLAPYSTMNIKFSLLKDTKNVVVMAGYIKSTKVERLSEIAELAYFETYPNDMLTAVALVMHKSAQEEVRQKLAEIEFTKCNLGYDNLAEKEIATLKEKVAGINKQHIELLQKVVAEEAILVKARQLYDYFVLEVCKLQCEQLTSSTGSSYYLEAWVPADKSAELDKTLEASPMALAYILRDPNEAENPPSLVENSAIVTPYQTVTNMYSAPAYNEIDPNPFVAFFFFIFFGMMLSDAGYGLLLVIATGIVLAVTKPPKGQGSLIKLLFMGGISTVIWGILFGSYFGIDTILIRQWRIPYWFNPMDSPMSMLYLSLAAGIIQLCFGVGVAMVAKIKEGKPFLGFCTAFSWYFLIIGIAGGMLGKKIAPWVSTAGWAMLGVGIVLLMLSGAIEKKGAKKITGGLASLYGIINFFSDLMSYTRIFGLGLATGVIGYVFNKIGIIIMNLVPTPIKFIGVIAAIFIFLIGHLFNVGINTLGAYVHNSRLQFVEFFGKFYSGGGHLFRPLGSKMKYYYVKPQEVNKQ